MTDAVTSGASAAIALIQSPLGNPAPRGQMASEITSMASVALAPDAMARGGLALGKWESSSEGKSEHFPWASRSRRFGKEFEAEAVRLVEVSGPDAKGDRHGPRRRRTNRRDAGSTSAASTRSRLRRPERQGRTWRLS